MCRAGGPRCNGRGRRNAQASMGTAVAERPPEPAGGWDGISRAVADARREMEQSEKPANARQRPFVPSHEDADRLAAELPAGRRGWNGKPLSEAERRRYALRESGWTGPVDQDGYPTSDDTGPAAGALRRMARDRGEEPDW